MRSTVERNALEMQEGQMHTIKVRRDNPGINKKKNIIKDPNAALPASIYCYIINKLHKTLM